MDKLDLRYCPCYQTAFTGQEPCGPCRRDSTREGLDMHSFQCEPCLGYGLMEVADGLRREKAEAQEMQGRLL